MSTNPLTPDPCFKLSARVPSAVKSKFAEFAERSQLSESELLRRMVLQVVAKNPMPEPVPQPGSSESFRGSRQIKLRLRGEELVAVEALAASEARTVPAWIGALVRRTALRVIPFNAAELEPLRHAIRVIGPMARNLNTLVRHWHQTGQAKRSDVEIAGLVDAVAALRESVLQLAEQASNRYSPGVAPPSPAKLEPNA